MEYTTEFIQEKIQTNDEWLIRALQAIFNKQTADEKMVEETRHHNKVGFTGADGNILTSMAKFYNSKKYLSPKQIFLVRKRMVKYSKQLAKIANGKL